MLKYLFIFFDKLDDWVDDIEYHLGNLIDPPLPFKEGDDTDKWCDKITARQALRYAKYMHKRWSKTKEIVENGDISTYKLKKDRELLQKFSNAVIKVAHYHEDLYRRMYQRKLYGDGD